MPDINETRRRNLRHLARQYGTLQLARILGHGSGSYISQMTGPNPVRKVSEVTARKVERELSLEPGSLDLDLEPAP